MLDTLNTYLFDGKLSVMYHIICVFHTNTFRNH